MVCENAERPTYWGQSCSGYDLDELEIAIFDTIESKWDTCEDYTVSVSEIARIFGRDPHNIRDATMFFHNNGIRDNQPNPFL